MTFEEWEAQTYVGTMGGGRLTAMKAFEAGRQALLAELGSEGMVGAAKTDGFRRAVQMNKDGLGGVNDIIREAIKAIQQALTE